MYDTATALWAQRPLPAAPNRPRSPDCRRRRKTAPDRRRGPVHSIHQRQSSAVRLTLNRARRRRSPRIAACAPQSSAPPRAGLWRRSLPRRHLPATVGGAITSGQGPAEGLTELGQRRETLGPSSTAARSLYPLSDLVSRVGMMRRLVGASSEAKPGMGCSSGVPLSPTMHSQSQITDLLRHSRRSGHGRRLSSRFSQNETPSSKRADDARRTK